MIHSGVYREFTRICGETVKFFEPMKKHTTWKIGGPAEIFAEPAGIVDLQRILMCAGKNNIPVIVIGNGSNILVTDKGVKGVVIKIGAGFNDLNINGNIITAGSGVKLTRLAYFAMDYEIGGFEFSAGIPGTVGGALVMNAGAEGTSISDVLKQVTVVDYSGNLKKYEARELNFCYRKSSLSDMNVIVTGSVFSGNREKREIIEKRLKEYLEKRKNNQPLKYPNAGSVFKNPPGESAGKLIENAGGKGLNVGGAEVSTLHANFLINRGDASAEDIMELMEKVKKLVYDKYGIELVPEVQIVGER